jgi:membrane protein
MDTPSSHARIDAETLPGSGETSTSPRAPSARNVSRRKSALFNPTGIKHLMSQTFTQWMADNGPRLGAALAYYTTSSLAPILVIAIAAASLVLGNKAAQNHIFGRLQGVMGGQVAAGLQALIQSAHKPATGIIAGAIAITTLLIGATSVFAELHDALNMIWRVEPRPRSSIRQWAKARLRGLEMILGIGCLVVVSLALSAGVSTIAKYVTSVVPVPGALMAAVELGVSFAVTTALFALIFKVLPEAVIAWSDVLVSAAVTALLFIIGEFAIGLYIRKAAIATSYGAAGSLAVLLVWIYYSAQIFYFGAEFAQVYANNFGSRLVPEPDAQHAPQSSQQPSA